MRNLRIGPQVARSTDMQCLDCFVAMLLAMTKAGVCTVTTGVVLVI